MRDRLRRSLPLVSFATLIYLPLALTERGVVVADTKSYLYLDPGRLLSRAASMWDPHVHLGTVTHQNIGYLWPMGPWYWAMEQLGMPDWLAQRLWLASIMFLAGLGVRYLLRTFGWQGPAVAVAMVVYALTPYVLTIAARISAILLPFTALPWLLALAIRAVRTGGWRHPAAFALIVTTAGTSNATAIILAGIAPVLWLVYAVFVSREASARRVAVTGARIGGLTLAASAWWIAGLSVQATNGLDVLRYTETAEVVAAASLAHEVLRGLGYWFFYGDDRLGPWIEPSVQYTQQLAVLAATYLLPALGLLAGAVTRFRHRAYFAGLLLAGVVLAVGAHPWDDPTPVGRAIKALLLTDAGLAMRSLPRAAPLVSLSLAVLLGAGVYAVIRRYPRATWPLAVALVALAVAAMPPLWQRGLVPENLRRPEEIPDYWHEAASHLEQTGDGTRVLEIPGSDFASYRWGNTVDPVTTGLTDRAVVARELVPFGSPASANLLNAFDGLLQAHIAEPSSFAPIGRLMRAGHVLVRSDLQYERYNLPRPRELWELVRQAPGLLDPATFGAPRPNTPVREVPLRDELELTLGPELPHPPPVAVFPVDDAVPVVAAKSSAAPVVLAGDGAGLVAAASAGVIDGTELVLYSAVLEAPQFDRALQSGAALVLTDSNRRQGERWHSVRYNRGYTEPAGLDPLRRDLSDNRLPVFPDAGDDARTVALHRGGITANATSYGNPVEFEGEDRPANAVDGDPATAWRTGAFSPVIGERLRLTLDAPVTTDEVTLIQATDGVNRFITKVRLRFDGGERLDVDLLDTSRGGNGQAVRFSPRTFRELEIEILDDTAGRRPRYGGLSSTGFSEVRIAGITLDEVIRLPVDLLEDAGNASLDHPLAVVLTRLRAAPTEATRGDEELSIVRALLLPTARTFALTGTARVSPRVADETIDRLVGGPASVTIRSSARLPGWIFRGSAAFDGDDGTVWSPTFGPQAGHWVHVTSEDPVAFDRVSLSIVADGRHSVPTRLGVDVDGARVATLDVPPVASGDEPGTTRTVELPLGRAVRGREVRFTVEDARAAETTDWYTRGPITMPVGVAEIGLPGLVVPRPSGAFDSGCREDLLVAGGQPVPVVVRGSAQQAAAGGTLTVSTCDGEPLELPVGENVLRAAQGRHTGIDLDRLVLRSAPGGGPTLDPSEAVQSETDAGVGRRRPSVRVTSEREDRLTLSVTGAQPGDAFWLAFGQSHNDGWQAKAAGEDLGDPVLVDGFANGWLVDPPGEDFTIDLRFTPQRRVRAALWLSGMAAVLCLALLVWPRRHGAQAMAREPRPSLWQSLVEREASAPRTRRRSVLVAIVFAAVAAAVAGPLVGVPLAAAAYLGMRSNRVRPWLALGAPAAMLAAGAYVVVWQYRHEIAPGFEWPSEFSRAHPLGWIAVLVLVADVVIERSRRAEPTGPTE